MCIVSGATMESVFQSGSWCREMAAGEDGKSSSNVLGLVAEVSSSPFVCVTIPSKQSLLNLCQKLYRSFLILILVRILS